MKFFQIGRALKMQDLERIRAILLRHKEQLHSRFHVERIAVFGSYARAENTRGSDVDILVELSQPIGWEIVDLHDYLEAVLGVRVDLVTLRAARRKPLLWQSISEDLVYAY